jgi:hypothetical protein
MVLLEEEDGEEERESSVWGWVLLLLGVSLFVGVLIEEEEGEEEKEEGASFSASVMRARSMSILPERRRRCCKVAYTPRPKDQPSLIRVVMEEKAVSKSFNAKDAFNAAWQMEAVGW